MGEIIRGWKSTITGLGESQTNNNNDWNHKNTSYGVDYVVGSVLKCFTSYLVQSSQ